MAIGLVRERSTSIEEWMETAAVARTFCQRFEDAMTTLKCRELIKFDLTSEEDRGRLMNSDIPLKVCIPAVATSFQIVMELLGKDH